MEDESVWSLLDTDAVLLPYLNAAQESTSSSISTIRSVLLKILSDPEIFAGFDQIKAILLPTLMQQHQQEGQKWLRTLDLFSYGVYRDYAVAQQEGRADQFHTLSDAQVAKLRQLTVLSLVEKACRERSDRVAYVTVQEALALPDAQRSVEEVLCSCLYARVLTGQLCQKTQSLRIGTNPAASSTTATNTAGGAAPVSHGPPCRPRDVPVTAVADLLQMAQQLQLRLQMTVKQLQMQEQSVTKQLRDHGHFLKKYQAVSESNNNNSANKKKGQDLFGSGLRSFGASGGGAYHQVSASADFIMDSFGGSSLIAGDGGDAVNVSRQQQHQASLSNAARRQKRTRGGLQGNLSDMRP